VDLAERAWSRQSGDLDFGPGHGREERIEMLGADERLVSLDIDVDVGGNRLGDGVYAVGAARAILWSEDGGKAVLLCEGEDFVGVGRDEDLLKKRAGPCGAINPADHRLSGDFAEDLARQARGAESRGDDADNAGLVGFGGMRISHRWVVKIQFIRMSFVFTTKDIEYTEENSFHREGAKGQVVSS
jgi:hypothetical protein